MNCYVKLSVVFSYWIHLSITRDLLLKLIAWIFRLFSKVHSKAHRTKSPTPLAQASTHPTTRLSTLSSSHSNNARFDVTHVCFAYHKSSLHRDESQLNENFELGKWNLMQIRSWGFFNSSITKIRGSLWDCSHVEFCASNEQVFEFFISNLQFSSSPRIECNLKMH